MPRSHVSIARFYDWTEDLGECVSISKFYRDLAVSKENDKMRGKGHKWPFHGALPGRMFLRDKAGLTKGEREIIEGICKNRGDVHMDDRVPHAHPSDEWDFVRSHKDAWSFRRHILNPRVNTSSDYPSDLKLPEELFSRVQINSVSTPRESCLFCNSNHKEISLKACLHKREEAPKAPPTTPDRMSVSDDDDDVQNPRTQRSSYSKLEEESCVTDTRRSRILRRKDSNGNQFNLSRSSERSNTSRDKKKVFVNVFLPRIPSDSSHDQTTSLAVDSRRNTIHDDKSSIREIPNFSRLVRNENPVSPSVLKYMSKVDGDR